MKFRVLSFVFCMWPNLCSSSANLEFISQKNVLNGKPIDINYQANDFYSTYYIYLNVVKALALEKHLTSKQIDTLIVKMIRGLKKNGMVQIRVSGYKGGELRATLRTNVAKTNRKPILMLITNYDAKNKRIVSENDLINAYATYFYLIRDKLVKFQLVHDKKNKMKKAKKTINGLADHYLLDDDFKNDKKGKKLLLKGIKTAKNEGDRFIMYLTLSEYYLLEKNTKKAKIVLEKAKAVADKISDDKRKRFLMNVYHYASDIYKHYVSYQKNG